MFVIKLTTESPWHTLKDYITNLFPEISVRSLDLVNTTNYLEITINGYENNFNVTQSWVNIFRPKLNLYFKGFDIIELKDNSQKLKILTVETSSKLEEHFNMLRKCNTSFFVDVFDEAKSQYPVELDYKKAVILAADGVVIEYLCGSDIFQVIRNSKIENKNLQFYIFKIPKI